MGHPPLAIAHSSTTRLASRSRSRSRNKWLPLSPPEQQARTAAKGTPLLQPWREHDTLRGLRDALRQVDDPRNPKSRRHPISTIRTISVIHRSNSMSPPPWE